MCGICGIIKFDNQTVQEAPIRKMMQLMKHRGPDDDGVFLEKNVGLGFVRLSIIDLSSAGHQPKFSQNERYVIVFNGEIYNYIELREELKQKGVVFFTETDTEVVLCAYIQWGEDAMHRFNGMWAFAIYDRQEKSVFAARDRFGVKPFYYIYNDQFFAFCSEIQPLFTLLDKKRKPNYQSIFDFLVFNRTDQIEDTFFEGVKKLQHGHSMYISENQIHPNLQVRHDRVVIKKWYDLKKKVSEMTGFKSLKEFKELLSSAINLHLRSDVPVGVCLSGGLDSSSIISILLEDFNKKEINTFSAIYNKGQFGDEAEFIDEYKQLVKHMFFTTPSSDSLKKDLLNFVKIHTEPFPNASPYAQFKVMELAKGKVVVTLGGQGADESLAGYHYFYGFYFKDLFRSGKIGMLSNEIVCYLKEHNSLFGIKSFLYFMLPKSLRTKVSMYEKNYFHLDFLNQHQNNNSISENIYGSNSLKEALIDHFEFKLEHLLKWEDRNSMAFSIEARTPFLDYRLVEKLLATPSDQKIKKGVAKYIFREAMKGLVPEKIRLRKDKMGFDTPADEWFRELSWQKIITDIINSESFKNRKIINPVKANDQYKKHLSGEINISGEIWKWIHLELWFREFIDSN